MRAMSQDEWVTVQKAFRDAHKQSKLKEDQQAHFVRIVKPIMFARLPLLLKPFAEWFTLDLYGLTIAWYRLNMGSCWYKNLKD